MPSSDHVADRGLTDKFVLALVIAAQAHREQVRKGSEVPYVGHLLGVCSLVIEEGGSEDEAIAALLHDAAEDQGGEAMLARIREAFGADVADIVRACSDTMVEPKPPWRERKENYLAHLEDQPPPVLLVSLADKLFNARAILRDYRAVGEDLWTRFNTGRAGQLWYYRRLSDAFVRLLPQSPMTRELERVVDELEEVSSRTSFPPGARVRVDLPTLRDEHQIGIIVGVNPEGNYEFKGESGYWAGTVRPDQVERID